MEILYLMVPLGLVLVGVGLWAFFWAVGSGQFDDLEGPAHRILTDDDRSDAIPGAPSQCNDAAGQHDQLTSIKSGTDRRQ